MMSLLILCKQNAFGSQRVCRPVINFLTFDVRVQPSRILFIRFVDFKNVMKLNLKFESHQFMIYKLMSKTQ